MDAWIYVLYINSNIVPIVIGMAMYSYVNIIHNHIIQKITNSVIIHHFQKNKSIPKTIYNLLTW